MNDSLLTTVCIQYRPRQVAAAVVYLSYLYMGLPRVDTTLLETDISVVAGKTNWLLGIFLSLLTIHHEWMPFCDAQKRLSYVADVYLSTGVSIVSG